MTTSPLQPQPYLSNSIPISNGSSSFPLSLPLLHFHSSSRYPKLCVLKSGGSEGLGKFASQDSFGSDYMLRKPSVMPALVVDESRRDAEGEWEGVVDWEDRILEETVPLVGFVRTILHSGRYESGSRLSSEHENTILEKLLPYHPESLKKIGCGLDYITVGYHPEYESSRCLFIVRKDGKLVDFSFWKCIKGLIRKNYPLYADTFISKHFRSRRS